MSTGEIDRALDALYAAYNGGDVEGVASLYGGDARHSEIAQGSVNEGATAIRDGLAGFLQAFPDAHWREEMRVVSSGSAAVAYRLTGTLRGKLGPFEPQGQGLDLRGVHLFTFEEEAIASSTDYWDGATFQRQMRTD